MAMAAPRFCSPLIGLALALLGGCATLTTSTSQTLTVMTEPSGAICTLKRDGQVIGAVNPTPGSLSVDKSHKAIDVVCTKDDFHDASGTVGSKFQAMTFGNILFGGIVGIVIDVASGATAEYEPTVTIHLTPSAFADRVARDAFFDQQRTTFTTQAQQVRERIHKLCKPTDCEEQLRLAAEEEQAGLARIETQRQSAQLNTR